MALEAGVPIIPLVVWGAHRIWTKDHPKHLGRGKGPIMVSVGPAFTPSGTVDEVMAELREKMTAVLHRVQEEYPRPEGEYWVPRRLGGGAPTLEEARVLDEAELAERARRRVEKS
jgi:1-acyl-sn-glycerol-3-phosphate acyltransferase